MKVNFTDNSKAWFAISCLALSAFVFNTTEFVPVGLLPNIAKSFDMTSGETGLIITIYAWCVSLLSLPLTIITAKLERKKLLVGLFIVFIGSHILAGFAWDFTSLTLARVGVACSHAIFWAITTPLAVKLAPTGKKAKAMGFIITGSSMAIVLGVPIGTMIGQFLGWRTTFLLIAFVALVVMILLMNLLPKIENNNQLSLRNLPELVKRPTLIHIYLLTAIITTGHYAVYSYITPFMKNVGGFTESDVVLFLLCIGISGIIGSLIFGRFSEKNPIRFFVGTVGLLGICLFLIQLSALSMASTFALCFIWGSVITIFGMLMQSKILDVAPDASDIATSIYSGIYNIGIGGGALVGSQILIHSSVNFIGYVGAIFVFIGLTIFLLRSKKVW